MIDAINLCLDAALEQIPIEGLERLKQHIQDGRPMLEFTDSVVEPIDGEPVG